jgi:predicted SprT family Zn-dependent metalloprotease
VINDWNDQYSPQKSLKTPRRKQLAAIESNDEDADGYISPSSSPRKTPSIKNKAVREAKKAFDSSKERQAEDFLKRLDSEITNGRISEMSKDTGGVRLLWSKKLNSTAGRASWRREGIIKRQSDGSVDKIYKHYASIELAEKVIDDEHRLYNTLAHEFCHLANFMISEVKDNPHGKEFKEWFVTASKHIMNPTDVNIRGKKCTKAFRDLGVQVTTKHSYVIDYKYIWECTECGTEFKRHSKSIDPKKHRCGRCKSLLIQTKPTARVSKTSDYQLFVKEHFQRLRKENAKESHAYVMKLVGELYREHKAKTTSNCEGKSMDQLVKDLDTVSLGE